MMQRLDLRGRSLSLRELREGLPRAPFDVEAALHTVEPICEDVRVRGAAALRDFAQRYDGVRPQRLRVPAEVLQLALEDLDPDVRAALMVSIERARIGHVEQARTDTSTQVTAGGASARSPNAGCRWIASASTSRGDAPSTRAQWS